MPSTRVSRKPGRGKRGALITFEGTEGAGKSTLIRTLARELGRRGESVVVTREPGGTRVSERIRKILLGVDMDPRTELFLYEAARAEHLAATVSPALARGDIVLCDRFTDSTLAYQASARGLDWKEVRELNRLATGGRSPDLTVWLDIDPAAGLRRAKVMTRFEAEGVEFQKKVRRGFQRSRREEPGRWLRLNMNQGQTPEQLTSIVMSELLDRKLVRPPTGRKKGGRRGETT